MLPRRHQPGQEVGCALPCVVLPSSLMRMCVARADDDAWCTGRRVGRERRRTLEDTLRAQDLAQLVTAIRAITRVPARHLVVHSRLAVYYTRKTDVDDSLTRITR